MSIWTVEETNFLKTNYQVLDRQLLILKLDNRSWNSIQSKVSALGLSNQYISWAEAELNFLRQNYSTASQDYLTTNLQNRKWESIRAKASVLGLDRIATLRKANLSVLLEETPITYYWIGFLMADGGFTERRIQLGVAEKDLDHLEKFRKFVNSTNKIGKVKSKHSDKLHYRIKELK